MLPALDEIRAGSVYYATIGRCANRIANGKFTLNGELTIWRRIMGQITCMVDIGVRQGRGRKKLKTASSSRTYPKMARLAIQEG